MASRRWRYWKATHPGATGSQYVTTRNSSTADTAMTTPNPILGRAPNHSTTASHGGFDNDVRVMEQTIQLIIGGKLAIPVEDLSY